ncbi:helix-turn-helix domain-containing protein [Oceanirhabdus sp. W0125-5]|uniref:helix-turn-helix domain-containing protein n=1 Tax=Oceanirhabdus sp. W0125-5 TaxID=2999116 RepID=UPI0022F32E7D|nr:helix-turn-helix domain-containing protein [Oceanirhabdus sp. W0125-5]WBW99146.1 ArsR family transcriptional regulator [Oceanirhabdus sp. W0125-5]
MIEKLVVKTREEIKIMTDPYRIEIINIMKNHCSPMTVKEIAEKMGEPHGKVYYHIKKLEKIDAIVLHHTRNIKGITAKYYEINFKELSISPSYSDDSNVNQALNMIASYYDASKRDFLNFYKKLLVEANRKDLSPEEESALKKKDDPYKTATLQNLVLYFTEEEFNSFNEDLKALLEKYDNEDSTKPYKKELFVSLYSKD